MKLFEVAVGGLCALAGGTSAAFATDESFFAFLSDPYSIGAYAPCLTALVAGLGALAAFRQLTVNTATNDQVEAVAAGVSKTHRVAKEAGRTARGEGAATRVTVRKESEKLKSGQAGIEAKIDELLAFERAKAAIEVRDFGPDAAKTFEEQDRAIRTSKDARKKPAQEALADNRSQDAADELMKVAAQQGAAAIDFAREAAEIYKEAASLYFNAQQPQKALEAYREATRLDGSDFWSWIYRSRLEDRQAGDVRGAKAAAEAALNAAQTERDKSVALNDLGDIAMKAGDLGAARTAFEESLEIVRRLAAGNSGSAEVQRDVSVSLYKLGDVAVKAGDFDAARTAFSESLLTRRKLAADNPGSAQAQRDVYASLFWVGEVAVQAGDLGAALTAFEESLNIVRRLAAANPVSAEAQRDVSISLERLGNVAVKAGDLGAARTALEESLDIARRLAAENPGSVGAQRDVSVSLNKLGDVEMQAGDLGAARTAFEESLETRRRFAEANPDFALAQRDVIASLDRLGKLTGDKAFWQEALEIAELLQAEGRLAPSDDFIPDWLRRQIAAAEEN